MDYLIDKFNKLEYINKIIQLLHANNPFTLPGINWNDIQGKSPKNIGSRSVGEEEGSEEEIIGESPSSQPKVTINPDVADCFEAHCRVLNVINKYQE